MTNLEESDIERGYDDERWLGWGYLGERSRCESVRKRHVADTVILRTANGKGWTYDQLFLWLNSKPGRHYADLAFGWGRWSMKALEVKATEWGVLNEVHEDD